MQRPCHQGEKKVTLCRRRLFCPGSRHRNCCLLLTFKDSKEIPGLSLVPDLPLSPLPKQGVHIYVDYVLTWASSTEAHNTGNRACRGERESGTTLFSNSALNCPSVECSKTDGPFDSGGKRTINTDPIKKQQNKRRKHSSRPNSV